MSTGLSLVTRSAWYLLDPPDDGSLTSSTVNLVQSIVLVVFCWFGLLWLRSACQQPDPKGLIGCGKGSTDTVDNRWVIGQDLRASISYGWFNSKITCVVANQKTKKVAKFILSFPEKMSLKERLAKLMKSKPLLLQNGQIGFAEVCYTWFIENKEVSLLRQGDRLICRIFDSQKLESHIINLSLDDPKISLEETVASLKDQIPQITSSTLLGKEWDISFKALDETYWMWGEFNFLGGKVTMKAPHGTYSMTLHSDKEDRRMTLVQVGEKVLFRLAENRLNRSILFDPRKATFNKSEKYKPQGIDRSFFKVQHMLLHERFFEHALYESQNSFRESDCRDCSLAFSDPFDPFPIKTQVCPSSQYFKISGEELFALFRRCQVSSVKPKVLPKWWEIRPDQEIPRPLSLSDAIIIDLTITEPLIDQSRINPKCCLTEDYWAVALIGYEGYRNGAHAQLVFEGLKDGRYFMKIADFNGGSSNKEKEGVVKLRDLSHDPYMLKKHRRSPLWKLLRLKVEKVLKKIEEEHQGKRPLPKFDITGSSSWFSSAGTLNCTDYATTRLREMGVELKSVFGTFISTSAIDYTKPLDEKQDEGAHYEYV